MLDEIIIDRYKLKGLCNKNRGEIIKLKENVLFFPLNNSKNNDEIENYFVDIKNNSKEHYIGVLTKELTKDIFGYILFREGDEYLGQISKEKREGFGIYKFNSDRINEEDFYIGYFSNNKIDGRGIHINIIEHSPKNELIKYNCNIGTFQNNKFIKGKIFSYDNGFEQLKFKDEDIKNDNGKKVINIEKNGGLITFTEGILKDKKLIEGEVLTINDDGKVENQFSYTLNQELQYNYDYLDDKNKIEELNNQLKEIKFNKYSINIQKMYEKIIEIIEKVKGDFNFAKDLIIEDNFKKNFNEYLQII
jgi:hypothetical protein